EPLAAGHVGHVVRALGEEGAPRTDSLLYQTTCPIKAIGPRASAVLLARYHEAGVLHAERFEDTPRQHIAERRVFDTRDEVSEQVGGVAVVERGSWLRDQWQGGESGDPLVGSHRTVDVAAEGTVEGLGEGTRPKGPVRQT